VQGIFERLYWLADGKWSNVKPNVEPINDMRANIANTRIGVLSEN
jgi:hypothetical protein